MIRGRAQIVQGVLETSSRAYWRDTKVPSTDIQGLSSMRTVMFDFYGTVVDMQEGLTQAITPYLKTKNYELNSPSRLVTWWRRTHFENSMIDSLLGQEHISYREVGRQAVEYTLTRAGIDHTPEEVMQLVGNIERLKPFPDVVDALTMMREIGLDLVILSNGDPDMLEAGVAYSGTADLWHRVISVAEAGYFKPHHTTYQTARLLIDKQPEQILFVANHAFDCIGAKAAGLRTAFVNRRDRPFGNDYYCPDLIVDDMAHLAKILSGQMEGLV
jgi:2-haloacid dehalogenase